jgi:hypothetical protein
MIPLVVIYTIGVASRIWCSGFDNVVLKVRVVVWIGAAGVAVGAGSVV